MGCQHGRKNTVQPGAQLEGGKARAEKHPREGMPRLLCRLRMGEDCQGVFTWAALPLWVHVQASSCQLRVRPFSLLDSAYNANGDSHEGRNTMLLPGFTQFILIFNLGD